MDLPEGRKLRGVNDIADIGLDMLLYGESFVTGSPEELAEYQQQIVATW